MFEKLAKKCLARSFAIVGLYAASVCSLSAAPRTVADFYSGKDLSLYVGSDAGGGFDLFARMLAPYLTKTMPGHPTVVVRNMPGAGGAAVVNYMLNNSLRDGTSIALINPVMTTDPILMPDIANWDSRKLTWLGSPSTEITTCAFWPHSGIKTLADLQQPDRKVIMAGSGLSGITLDTMTLRSLMNWKWQIVSGYPGTADAITAAERGEIDGACGLPVSLIRIRLWNAVQKGDVHVLLQNSLTTNPAFPEAVNSFTLAKTPEQKQIMELVFGPWKFGRPFITAPGVPADRLAALREALAAATADPGLAVDAKKLGFQINYVSPTEIADLVNHFYATPPDVLAKTKSILNLH